MRHSYCTNNSWLKEVVFWRDVLIMLSGDLNDYILESPALISTGQIYCITASMVREMLSKRALIADSVGITVNIDKRKNPFRRRRIQDRPSVIGRPCLINFQAAIWEAHSSLGICSVEAAILARLQLHFSRFRSLSNERSWKKWPSSCVQKNAISPIQPVEKPVRKVNQLKFGDHLNHR